ncbi:MAG: hypothetical protein HS127_16770 [Planctomycetia bacterium]|nr:hypothetical protein [Planctomycetia bacterium]
MNKGVDNNVKQPISAFMKVEIDMGTLHFGQKHGFCFVAISFSCLWIFHNIHALPFVWEMGRRMKFPNVRSPALSFYVPENLTKLVLVKRELEVNRR